MIINKVQVVKNINIKKYYLINDILIKFKLWLKISSESNSTFLLHNCYNILK